MRRTLKVAAFLATALISTPVVAQTTAPSFSVKDVIYDEDNGVADVPTVLHGTRSLLPSVIEVYINNGTALQGEDFDYSLTQFQFLPTDFGKYKYIRVPLINDNIKEAT